MVDVVPLFVVLSLCDQGHRVSWLVLIRVKEIETM